jgi:hypothetical protein
MTTACGDAGLLYFCGYLIATASLSYCWQYPKNGNHLGCFYAIFVRLAITRGRWSSGADAFGFQELIRNIRYLSPGNGEVVQRLSIDG